MIKLRIFSVGILLALLLGIGVLVENTGTEKSIAKQVFDLQDCYNACGRSCGANANCVTECQANCRSQSQGARKAAPEPTPKPDK